MSNTPTTAAATTTPRIGIAVFILHLVPDTQPQQYKFILGRRLGSHGSNTWALPGGHLEHGESFEACAIRETLEETDLDIHDVRFLTVTNDLMPNLKDDRGGVLHYATIFMVARVKAADAQAEVAGDGMPVVKVMEPLKCAGWEWVSWEEMEGWARSQISRESLSAEGEPGSRKEVGESTGLGEDGNRQLFTPMVNLLLQRPGVVPS